MNDAMDNTLGSVLANISGKKKGLYSRFRYNGHTKNLDYLTGLLFKASRIWVIISEPWAKYNLVMEDFQKMAFHLQV